MKVYAHRGASAAYPENTLAAFAAALALGVEGIELDVHGTVDGVPVVIHDRDVTRTTNGSGNVDEMDSTAVAALDAGNGEGVPTLAAVLDLVGDRAHLDIEVKGVGIAREVLTTLAASPGTRWAVSSFNWDTLRELRRLDTTAALWPLASEVTDDLLRIAADLGSPAIALFHDAYTEKSAQLLREAGRDVMIWTVNDGREARRVRGLGATAVCSDAPDRIMAALAQ
jgi:glycerophosphoryl diester phosphodiesterase